MLMSFDVVDESPIKIAAGRTVDLDGASITTPTHEDPRQMIMLIPTRIGGVTTRSDRGHVDDRE